MKRKPSDQQFELMVLVAGRRRSGREVAKLYEAETGSKISYGALYTTFRRLKESGWVDVSDSDDTDGRVRYFVLTGEGQRVVDEARARYERQASFGLGAADAR